MSSSSLECFRAHAGYRLRVICSRLKEMCTEAAKRGGLEIATQPDYCGRPSTVNERNVAYLSPIFRRSLYSAELRQACILSMLSQTWIATRGFGGAPSIAVTFCPAARKRPPIDLINA